MKLKICRTTMDHLNSPAPLNEELNGKEDSNENQTLISMVDVLTPASSPTNSGTNKCVFSNLVSTTNQRSAKQSNSNGLNDTETMCRSNSTNSNCSELSSPVRQSDQAPSTLSSDAPFPAFPFFNAFNFLHPILNGKHLYSTNGLNFSPFTYLNQLQNMRQLTSPTMANAALGNTTNLVNALNNSCTTIATTVTNPVLTDSVAANRPHALRKEDINSLVTGRALCS